MKILFWNMKKKDLSTGVLSLIEEYEFDVLVFCEFEIEIPNFLRTINVRSSVFKFTSTIGCDKIKIFTKFSLDFSSTLAESKRWSIRKISHPFYSDFLLAASHLPSKNYWNEESQLMEASIFRSAINNIELETGISKTIIIGDLNMNPFEPGLTTTTAFHSTQDLNIAKKGSRVVQGVEYNYFYNPMWNFFGDKSKGQVPGTYLYSASQHTNIDWNIYDQILLSPSIADDVPIEEIDIISKVGTDNLVNKNQTINSKYSDHLPIKLKIIPTKI